MIVPSERNANQGSVENSDIKEEKTIKGDSGGDPFVISNISILHFLCRIGLATKGHNQRQIGSSTIGLATKGHNHAKLVHPNSA
jgi:hypothetical protein